MSVGFYVWICANLASCWESKLNKDCILCKYVIEIIVHSSKFHQDEF